MEPDEKQNAAIGAAVVFLVVGFLIWHYLHQIVEAAKIAATYGAGIAGFVAGLVIVPAFYSSWDRYRGSRARIIFWQLVWGTVFGLTAFGFLTAYFYPPSDAPPSSGQAKAAASTPASAASHSPQQTHIAAPPAAPLVAQPTQPQVEQLPIAPPEQANDAPNVPSHENAPPVEQAQHPQAIIPASPTDTAEAKLKELDELLFAGSISNEEYEQRRKVLLNQ